MVHWVIRRASTPQLASHACRTRCPRPPSAVNLRLRWPDVLKAERPAPGVVIALSRERCQRDTRSGAFRQTQTSASSRAPSRKELEDIAWSGTPEGDRTARARIVALTCGEGVAHMGLGDVCATVRKQLGLREEEPTASVWDADDAHDLMCAFDVAYGLSEVPRDAGYRLERELASKGGIRFVAPTWGED